MRRRLARNFFDARYRRLTARIQRDSRQDETAARASAPQRSASRSFFSESSSCCGSAMRSAVRSSPLLPEEAAACSTKSRRLSSMMAIRSSGSVGVALVSDRMGSPDTAERMAERSLRKVTPRVAGLLPHAVKHESRALPDSSRALTESLSGPGSISARFLTSDGVNLAQIRWGATP